MICVALYDDHTFVTDAMKQYLSVYADIDIVGVGNTIDDVLSIIDSTNPDLLIADIFSDENRGTTLFVEAFKKNPNLKIIIFSSITSSFLIDSLYQMGITAIVNKNEGLEHLYTEIIKVTKNINSTKKRIQSLPSLTPREKEIVRLLCEGYASKEIAAALGNSFNTIDNQKKALLKKFNCSNSTELVVKLGQMGLISVL
ncbi:MAG: response regulator transcription factor [Saprospiraceae bacterium]|nr:response regulator transcription factor [Saprospiraceae bacterium]